MKWDESKTHPNVFRIGACIIKLPNPNNYQDMAVLMDIRDNPIPTHKSETEIRAFRLQVLSEHGTRLLIRVAKQLWEEYIDLIEAAGDEPKNSLKFILDVLKIRVQINRNKDAFIEAQFNPNNVHMNEMLYGK